MADQITTPADEADYASHATTYDGFLKGAIALGLICFFILESLVAFRFMNTLSVLWGFLVLIVGIVATVIDVRAGGRWLLSGGLLVVFGLLTAIFIS